MRALPPDFYLASASPRRKELLAQLGYRFGCLQVEVDETPLPDESPAAVVLRLAAQKAAAGVRLHAHFGLAILRRYLPPLRGLEKELNMLVQLISDEAMVIRSA